MEWEEFNNRQAHQEDINASRIGHLGGSDATMVYKVGRKGINSICATDKKRLAVCLGLTEPTTWGGNKWTDAGHDFEDNFGKELETRGVQFEREKLFHGEQFNHFATCAHADFVVRNTVYECKCVKSKTYEAVLTRYFAQLQWYYMLGADKVFLVHATAPTEKYTTTFVPRNETVINIIRDGLKLLDTYCATLNKENAAIITENVLTLPMEVEYALWQWKEYSQRIQELTTSRNRFAATVVQYMQTNAVDIIETEQGERITLDKQHRQINERLLAELFPETLQAKGVYQVTDTTIKIMPK